ncbi:MAG: hypothetical protein K5657_02940 [Desulfovibrio sp.]|nr:hypothetical protein [Desulfovibrio sp.]
MNDERFRETLSTWFRTADHFGRKHSLARRANHLLKAGNEIRNTRFFAFCAGAFFQDLVSSTLRGPLENPPDGTKLNHIFSYVEGVRNMEGFLMEVMAGRHESISGKKEADVRTHVPLSPENNPEERINGKRRQGRCRKILFRSA